MLVSDVGTRVKRQFGDEVGAQIDDEDIIRWCNDAQQEIALQQKLLQTTAVVPTVVNQQDYTLPTDLLALRGVRYDKVRVTGITMDEIDNVLKDRTEVYGIPQYYWLFSNTLSLWPTPDDIKNITIYYTKVPTALAAVGDTISLPAQFNNRIVEYCIAQAAELDNDLEHYQLKMGQFQAGIDQVKNVPEQTEIDDSYPYMSYNPEEYDG